MFQGTNETLEGKPAQEMESGDTTPCGKGEDGAGSWWGPVNTELRLCGMGEGEGAGCTDPENQAEVPTPMHGCVYDLALHISES